MQIIINNLIMVFSAMLFLILAWFANMSLSLYSNIAIGSEKFCFKKLIQGFTKLLVLCISTAVLTLIITLLPVYLTKYGMQIEGFEEFNVLSIAIVYATMAFNYFKKAIGKLVTILNSEDNKSETNTLSE